MISPSQHIPPILPKHSPPSPQTTAKRLAWLNCAPKSLGSDDERPQGHWVVPSWERAGSATAKKRLKSFLSTKINECHPEKGPFQKERIVFQLPTSIFQGICLLVFGGSIDCQILALLYFCCHSWATVALLAWDLRPYSPTKWKQNPPNSGGDCVTTRGTFDILNPKSWRFVW